MGALVAFFSGPARLKGLIAGAGVALVACLGLAAHGQYWRAEAKQAALERDLALAQAQVLSGSLAACNAGVDRSKAVGDAAIAAMGEMLAKARKLALPREKTIERIETVIHQAPKPGEGCDWAWGEIEREQREKPREKQREQARQK